MSNSEAALVNDAVSRIDAPSQQRPSFDDNYSWVDPKRPDRFIRRELEINREESNTSRLRNIVRIADQIYDDLTVLEGSSEAQRRGWVTLGEQATFSDWSPRLEKIEEDLLEFLRSLRRQRDDLVAAQLARIGIDDSSREIKLHIGSAGHPLDGWLNVDIANSDLNINVNWGMPLKSESVSRVYCAHLLEHLRYRDQAPVFVGEIFRVLQPGGVARFVVPDIRRLALAYATKDKSFFDARRKYYAVGKGFEEFGVPSLDYLLLFCGAGPQTLTLNHKFGYDIELLSSLLAQAGFSKVVRSSYQGSESADLRVDNIGYNAGACDDKGQSFSIFVDAIK